MKRFRMDLIVTDLKMPIMDGFALVTRLATDFPLTRVLVVSSDISPLEDIGWLKLVDRLAGYDKIRKPTVLNKFITKVERLLAADQVKKNGSPSA